MRPNTLGLPGPSQWVMARGFRAIRSDPLTFLEEMHSRYGDLVAFPVPGSPALLLSDPEAVSHVLQGNSRNWTKATLQYSGESAVSLERREVITYDGTAVAKVAITQNGTTKNCTRPLPRGPLSCS